MSRRPLVLALFLAVAAACTREPAPRADLSASAFAASRGGRPESRAAGDTIAPLAPPGLPPDSFPEPDRPVAKITTDTWSNESARDEAGEARRVLDLLDVREGMSVADIGAGSGYYTVRLARAVGPSGRVYAEDIVLSYLEKLRDRVRKEGLTNVTLALGDHHDPRLPAGSIDLALLAHMYHEVEQPYGLLYNLYPALRPGGRVAVIDLDKPTARHGTPPDLLRCEFEAVGYSPVDVQDLGVESGYLAVFAAPASREQLIAPESIEACAVS